MQTVSYNGAFLGANLPSEYKTTKSLNEFKTNIKKTGEWKHVLERFVKKTFCKGYI